MADEPKKMREGCTFRTNDALVIQATGQWIPKGVIADLSDCSDASIRSLLQRGLIETADPSEDEPVFNTPIGNVAERKPCPCNK